MNARRLSLLVPVLLAAACNREPQDLSTQQLSQAVSQQQPTLKRCYDLALGTEPYRQDVRMQAVLEIAPSGSVRSVELTGSGLPGMPDCIRKAIKTWRFPEARDATHTSLPLIFHPEVVNKGAPDPAAFQRAIQGIMQQPPQQPPPAQPN